MLFKGKDPKPKIFLDVLFLCCLGFTPLAWGLPPLALGLPFHCLGFPPLAGLSLRSTTRGLPPKWAPAHVSGHKGKPSNTFNNEFDNFLAGVEIGFLASTWGLHPWPGLGRLLESSTWGLPPLPCFGFTLLIGLSLGFTPLTTRGLPPKWPPPHVSRQMGKPSNRFNNEFDYFLAGVEIGFLASTWVYPPGLALADYWNHLLGVYPPWLGVYPPSLALGLPF